MVDIFFLTKGPTMSSLVTFPSLSEDGWITSSLKVADYLFSHFILSDYSQTYNYNTHVSSLPWIIHETQGDMSQTVRLTENTLSYYFSRYFNSVVVEVNEVPNEKDPSVGQISIYISFTDTEGKTFTLSRLLEIADTTIKKVLTLSNG